MRFFYSLCLLLLLPVLNYAQSKGNLVGEVIDKNTQKPIYGASVKLVNTKYATQTDSLGKYIFKEIPTGQYHVLINSIGSIPYHLYNVIVGSGNINYVTAELTVQETVLKDVIVGNVKKTVRAATLETPLSIQKLTAEEIKSSPGSNFDISKVVQTLPGVTGSATTGAGFRNDIIVRGGAPNENVFYLDGIEIPVINHFSTQGSAGGPQGILNVSFIDEVKLSSSAFDAKYDNALSSVFEFKQKKGNSEKVQGNFRLGATEVASTLEGPLSKNGKTTFLLSARRSYLQFLFRVLDLPIRPNYWDFQYKVSHQIDPKTTLTFLGLGAIDKFYYVAPQNSTPEKRYALNISPTINQWSYTVGVSLKKLINKGYWNLSASRSHLNNVNEKYEDNLNPDKGEKTFDYTSNDISNNLRFDITKSFLGLKWTTGANLQSIEYDNATFQILPKPYVDSTLLPTYLPAPNIYRYATNLNFRKYGAFFQLGKRAFNNRLGISAGIRTDGNGFNTAGRAFYNRLSPRIGFSYVLTDKINVSASVGRYFKVAPNTALGFKDLNGNYVNRESDYIGSNHYVTGIEYIPSEATRFTAEVFYKRYFNVPISIQKGLSLSNLGADFNILGNEPISSTGKGRSYGYELFAQQKLTKRFFGVASYSFFRSAYTNLAGEFIKSSWENIHVLSLTGGYKFNKNWELGIKYRFQGGTPYTPFDNNSSRINFLTQGLGVLDYSKVNTLRLPNYHSSDLRIDKKYNYKKTTFDFFLDITNWYGSMSVSPSVYIFESNPDGSFKTSDGKTIKKDGSNAIPSLANSNRVLVTPTFGFIWEF
jgi:hypothetical protein